MEFGSVPVEAAEGAVLAHSVALPGGRLRKGGILGPADIQDLLAAGVAQVTVARLGSDDMGEDPAALAVAQALVDGGAGIVLSDPFTGRVNILAGGVGLARLDAARVHALNAVDPMITLATVPDWQRMGQGGMIATVKIIAYGVARRAVEAACAAGRGAVTLAPIRAKTASLIVTQHGAGSGEDTGRGYRAIEGRLDGLGMTLFETVTTAHDARAVADEITRATGDIVLVLTASATSDPQDVGPEALRLAGGRMTRFGMPVDPGNLLFFGDLSDGRPLLGLPGCARSPALNGADWVLERIAAGAAPSDADIAGMGLGGLLKEIPQRKQPRAG